MYDIEIYEDKISIFTKSTQKTPKNEIEKAKRLLEDYKKRCNET